MNNPQQPASPVKAEVQVVMLDTERYQELLHKEEQLDLIYAEMQKELGFDDGL